MTGPCIQILKGVPLASTLQLYKEDGDLNLVGFEDNSIFTLKLPNDLGEVDRVPLQSNYQELTVGAGILSVFKWTDKYTILDCEGVLHQISHSSLDADSVDLFDDPPLDERISSIKKVRQVSHRDVVAASFIPPDFLVELSYCKDNLNLLVVLHRLDTTETLQTLVVYRNVMSKPDKMFVEYVDSNDVEKEFLSSWFPHFNYSEPTRGYLFVYNCEESACCVQLGLEALTVGFFFSWPSPCVFSCFCPPVMKDGELKRNLLLLSFENGAVAGLNSSGGRILHFTSKQTKCVSYSKGLLLSSNYTDCQVTPVDPVDASSVLPIKGVISFCLLDDNKAHVLALTTHGGLYLVRADVKLSEEKCQVPAVSSFQETVNNIGYLEELNSRIAAQDSSIKCLATVANAKNFRFKLDLQVVQIMGGHHLFRVTCESLAADIGTSPVLQAKDWHVIFMLSYTNHDRIVNVQQFPSDFSKNQPLEFMVRLNMEAHSLRDCLAVVKFISFVGEGKYRPTLMVGKVRLNVLSFLEPEYSLLAHTASSSCKAPSVIDLLRTQSIDYSDDQCSTKDMKELTFVLEIPTKGVDALSIVEKLLERSKALWRVKPWELCHSTTSVSMVVQNDKISVDIAGDKATVSSHNPGLVILMKHAIISIVGGPPLQGIDEAVLMEAENILQSLEMMELAAETPPRSEVLNIYKKKIKLINDSLVGVFTLVD